MIRSGKVGKTGRIRLKGEPLRLLRQECFERDRWKCQDCGIEIRWDGWNAGEMAHIQSRGAGGSDVLENIRTLCKICHQASHNPKSVPRK